MMSYLWILLLGSLLASNAKAQDEEALATQDTVTEEAPVAGADAEDAPPTQEPNVGDELELVPEEVTTPAAAASDEDEDTEADDGETEPTTVEDSEIVAPTEEGGLELPAETTALPEIHGLEELGETTPAGSLESEEAAETTPAGDLEPELVETTTLTGDADLEVPTEGSAETTTLDSSDVEPVATTVLPVEETPAIGLDTSDDEISQTTTNEAEEAPSTTEAAAHAGGIGADEKTTAKTTTAAVTEEDGPSFITEAVIINKVIPGARRNFGSAPRSDKEADVNIAADNKPQAKEGSSKPLAGILSAIVVSAVGAVSGYFAYQKKKLCFKNRQEPDPETGHKAENANGADAQSNPEANTLLPTSQTTANDASA